MHQQDMTLMAHLLRRAGFGATRDELEAYVAQGYEAVVEELLHPGDPQTMPEDLIRRYHVDQSELRQLDAAGANWLYRMITTRCPLEEKMALFWHSLFATGYCQAQSGQRPPQSDRHVPAPRSRAVRYAAGRALQRPGDAYLARQQ